MTVTNVEIYNMNRILDYVAIDKMELLGLFLEQAVGEDSYIELIGDNVSYYAYTKNNDLMQTATQLTSVDLTNVLDWDNQTYLRKRIHYGTPETTYIVMDFGSIDERVITYHIKSIRAAYINVYISNDNTTYTKIDNITQSHDVISAKKESFRYLKLTYGNGAPGDNFDTYIYFIHVFNPSEVAQTNSTNVYTVNIVDKINIYNTKFCVVFEPQNYSKVSIYEFIVKDKLKVIS